MAEGGGVKQSRSIDQLRDRIDELDRQLVTLLSERATCALAVGRLKEEAGHADLSAGSRG